VTKKIIVAVVNKRTETGHEWRGAIVNDGAFSDAIIEKGLSILVMKALSQHLVRPESPEGTQVTVEVTINEPEV
jgi:hypothetical protein